jgi:small subunit ribosomal protein S15
MINTKDKSQIIKKHARHDKDTGSPEVQIALLTKRIELVSKHLKKNTKDVSSRRGLLSTVASRRKWLNYLKQEDPKRYQKIVKKLDL